MKLDANMVFTVCITGGPCGGKTTSLGLVSELAREGGGFAAVYRVPEMATFLHETCGVDRVKLCEGNPDGLRIFNTQYQRLQREHEDRVSELAAAGPKPALVLCDRGMLDTKCYVPPALWEHISETIGDSDPSLLKRYDVVLHMVTAADGAADAYETAGNAARIETAAEALERDRAVKDVYSKHPKHRVVDNSKPGGMEGKAEAAFKALKSVFDIINQGCQMKELERQMEAEARLDAQEDQEKARADEDLRKQQEWNQEAATLLDAEKVARKAEKECSSHAAVEVKKVADESLAGAVSGSTRVVDGNQVGTL